MLANNLFIFSLNSFDFFKAQIAFDLLVKALDLSEPKGAWQYYEIAQVVARVVRRENFSWKIRNTMNFEFQCGRSPQILQQTQTLLQRALDIDSVNSDYLVESGYQAIMRGNINDAIKFYKTAGKTQAENMSAVYGNQENVYFHYSIRFMFVQELFIVKFLKESMTMQNNKLNFKTKSLLEIQR